MEAGEALVGEPGSGIRAEKGARDRLIRWGVDQAASALGYGDECWWSRLKDPQLHAWSEERQPVRLVEKEVPDGEPKALACYGLWLPGMERMLLRFVDGRPVSRVTVEYLEWVSAELWQAGTRALFLVWDNASWHGSREVKGWIKAHNRKVKQGKKEGVRLIVCPLPSRAPWLNPIEPKWLHAKRAVAEPGALLDETELMARVYEHFGCPAHPLLSTVVT